MQAITFQGFNKPLSVTSLPDPTPGSNEVLISVARCGICGSDLHMSEDHDLGAKPGDVFGHEFAGEVIDTGKGVSTLKKGDYVSVIPLKSCGKCPTCLAGEPAWCNEMMLQGGGYAEYAAVKAEQCIKLPKTFSLADGALAEPLAVALHGVALSGLKPADKVLVIGGGPIGLAVAFWARRLGSTKVVVQDIAPDTAERAYAMGATDFVCTPDDPVGGTDEAFGGKADIVFECVGAPGLIMQASQQLRPKGSIVVLGLCTKPETIIPFQILAKEIRILTSAFFKHQEYVASLDVLDTGAFEVDSLVSDTVSLGGTPSVFEELKGPSPHCKVLIDPAKTTPQA